MNDRSIKTAVAKILRPVLTLTLVGVAAVAGWRVWVYYQVEPWTPEGRVRADIIEVAPDVSGIVTEVAVDDHQSVKRGQPLFRIDQARYVLALRQAEAVLTAKRATLAQTQRDAQRNQAMGELVAKEVREQWQSKVELAGAEVAQALVARDLASLDLERTLVVAPADGILSDLMLQVGDAVTVGKACPGTHRGRLLSGRGLFRGDQAARHPRRPVCPGQADGRGAGHQRPCAEHRLRHRRPRSGDECQFAAQCDADRQLGASGPKGSRACDSGCRPAGHPFDRRPHRYCDHSAWGGCRMRPFHSARWEPLDFHQWAETSIALSPVDHIPRRSSRP